MTKNALGVHQCTVSKTLATYQLTAKFSRDVRESVRTFGMIQVFGCIDGTHIPIKRPLTDSLLQL